MTWFICLRHTFDIDLNKRIDVEGAEDISPYIALKINASGS